MFDETSTPAEGHEASPDAERSAVRLASLMDGLAIQLALDDPGMSTEAFTSLWLEAAALELRCPALR